MSQAGIDAARILRELSPEVAAVVAAELRNAVTPASCTVQEMHDYGSGAVRVQDHVDRVTAIADTVSYVLALASALQGAGQ